MHKLKARAVSFLTAILLVFTLLPLLPVSVLRRIFGGFLIIVAVREGRRKN